MDASTYIHPSIREMIRNHCIPIKLNAESGGIVINGTQRYTQKKWAKMRGVKGYPAFVFYDPTLNVIQRIDGYGDAQEFYTLLKYIADGYYKKYSFDDYQNMPSR